MIISAIASSCQSLSKLNLKTQKPGQKGSRGRGQSGQPGRDTAAEISQTDEAGKGTWTDSH